ncbi:hypothetical protein [Streptomyces sp. SudanB66_2053]|uniref:hypothetical protein n=1 Tax=Streptomyces sp. SudanB66_2053 TaxID=3035277 RepID=UPI003F56923C
MESKVVQYQTVRKADPDLAFSTTVLSDEAALDRYLAGQGETVKVLRPEFSDNTGSALFSRPTSPVPPKDLAGLWRDGGRVVAHDFIPGTPYFANGVIVNGQLRLTDTWRCFSLDEGSRSLLTSVINVLPDAPEVLLFERRLQLVVTTSGVTSGPVCFEVVLNGAQVKVVKVAFREAGEPLPMLCHLIGIDGQRGDRAETPNSFIADYSFTVRRGGILVGFNGLDEVRRLASYRADLRMPALGDALTPTVGETETTQVLLMHPSEETVLGDINRLQELNRSDLHVLSTDRV